MREASNSPQQSSSYATRPSQATASPISVGSHPTHSTLSSQHLASRLSHATVRGVGSLESRNTDAGIDNQTDNNNNTNNNNIVSQFDNAGNGGQAVMSQRLFANSQQEAGTTTDSNLPSNYVSNSSAHRNRPELSQSKASSSEQVPNLRRTSSPLSAVDKSRKSDQKWTNTSSSLSNPKPSNKNGNTSNNSDSQTGNGTSSALHDRLTASSFICPDTQSLTAKMEALQKECASIEALLEGTRSEPSRDPINDDLKSKYRSLRTKADDIAGDIAILCNSQNKVTHNASTSKFPPAQNTLGQKRQYGVSSERDESSTSGQASKLNSSGQTYSKSVYLLQGPNGPQAIVYHNDNTFITPQNRLHFSPVDPHTFFRNRFGSATSAQYSSPSGSRPLVVPTPLPNNSQNQNQNQNQNQARPRDHHQNQNQPNARNEQNANPGGIHNFAGRIWLLFQIIIFIFLFGASLSPRRQIVLAVISIVFCIAQLGVFGDRFERMRRYIESLLPTADLVPPVRRDERQQQEDIDRTRRASAAAARQEGASAPQHAAHPGGEARRPSPRETAQRMIREHRTRLWNDFVYQLRRLERVFTLFLATLWPGVGERHVAARREAQEQQDARREAERRRNEGGRALGGGPVGDANGRG